MTRNCYERQEIASIFVDLTPADIAGGGFTAKLPQGSWVFNVAGYTQTAFNTAGDTPTCKVTLSDGTTTFINAQSIASTGDTTVAVTKKFYQTGGTLTGTITEGVATGAITTATAGLAVIRIDYVQIGRQCFNEG